MANDADTEGVGTMADQCDINGLASRSDAQIARCELDGPRAPRPDELDAVLDLVNNTFNPMGRTMGLEFPQLLSDANLARLRVFVDPQTRAPVAHAGYVRCELAVEGCRIPAAGLGSVCTEQAYRGMGLASELVESITQQAVAEGLVMMLISGGSNVYRRLGAADTGDFLRVEANREQISNLREAATDWPMHLRAAMRLAAEDDIPAMASIYRREPVRYVRSVSDFRGLAWQEPGVKRLGSLERTWIGGLASDSLAYVIVRIRTADHAADQIADHRSDHTADHTANHTVDHAAHHATDHAADRTADHTVDHTAGRAADHAAHHAIDRGETRLHVAEFAGARCCVQQLVAHACAEYDPDILTMAVPGSDLEMATLLHQAGLTLHHVGLLGHTVMSLDDRALLECVGPIMNERFGADWTMPSPPPAGPELIRWLFADLRIPLPVPGLNYV